MNTWVVLLVTWFCQTLLSPSTVAAQDCSTYPDKRLGDCISVLQCPSLNTILQQVRAGTGSSNGLDLLRKSVCANDGSSVRVCCPRTTTNPTNPTPSPSPDIRNDPSRPRQCGLNFNTDRIVNGENAQLAAWPWMVIFRARLSSRNSGTSCRDNNPSCPGWAAIGQCQINPDFMLVNCRSSCNNCPSSTGPSNWICGGVLITEQYVLSAAHCFKSNIQIEFARIGEFDLSKNPDTGRGLTAPQPQDINVERVITHPDYRSPCRRCNDIALVKLAQPAQLHSFFVQPICLPSNPEQDMGFSVAAFQNKLGFVTGWGVTDPEDIFTTRGADILQQANLTIQERSFCQQQKVNYPDDRMILCAGQGDGQDVCRADSGGPLMLSDRFAQKWYIVGITSFGATVCGDRSAQGVFTSVHHYRDWINQIIL